MNADAFYQRIVKIAAQPAYNRYALLAEFHTDATRLYLHSVRNCTPQDAARLAEPGQTVAQSVACIAEWERYTILAAAEMMAGIRWPRLMSMSGYLEPEGETRDFDSAAAFNSYVTARYASSPWQPIQDLALHTATALHSLFTQPTLLSPDTLQRTNPRQWVLPNGIRLTLPAGWYLWMVSIERELLATAGALGSTTD